MTRKPGISPSLTRDLIVSAAFDMIDTGGLESFSIRSLAERLHVSPMALYTYFPSKEDILTGVRARLSSMYDNEPIPGERWDDSLKRTMSSIRAVDLAHPNVYMGLRSYGWDPSVKPHTRRIYQLYKDQGMPIEVYRQIWCFIEAFLVGFIGQEIKQRHTVYETIDADDPDRDWMAIAETAYTDESFLRGIDLIIRAVEQIASPDPCDWRTPLDRDQWNWQKND